MKDEETQVLQGLYRKAGRKEPLRKPACRFGLMTSPQPTAPEVSSPRSHGRSGMFALRSGTRRRFTIV